MNRLSEETFKQLEEIYDHAVAGSDLYYVALPPAESGRIANILLARGYLERVPDKDKTYSGIVMLAVRISKAGLDMVRVRRLPGGTP